MNIEAIRNAPKVVLHDHLDGGLRPGTIIDLARECGYQGLPTADAQQLGRWFRDSADSGSLERYLQTFDQTLAVMQTRDGIERVASECAQDLADDGVVYAEVRFAPEQHLRQGLSLEQVVQAVLDGFAEGCRMVAESGRGIRIRTLVSGMRQLDRVREIAELLVAFRGSEVAGFDIAGPEAGFPPTNHLDAFDLLGRECEHVTIHAGEADGVSSIWEATQLCGAERIGHGVRIADEVVMGETGVAELSHFAAYLRDRQIPLELSPTSNVQTGAAVSIADHPFDRLRKAGFAVTVNTDNRLMSGVTVSSEMACLADAFGYGWADLQEFTINAMQAAFLPLGERTSIIENIIRPGYAALRGV